MSGLFDGAERGDRVTVTRNGETATMPVTHVDTDKDGVTTVQLGNTDDD
jgi:hypothetical protein